MDDYLSQEMTTLNIYLGVNKTNVLASYLGQLENLEFGLVIYESLSAGLASCVLSRFKLKLEPNLRLLKFELCLGR